jgi:hypothetical protein
MTPVDGEFGIDTEPHEPDPNLIDVQL